MFIDFVSFYYYFIWGFSKKAILFILIVKITRLLDLALRILRIYNNIIVVRNVSKKTNKMVKNLSRSKMLKNDKFESLTRFSNIEAIR